MKGWRVLGIFGIDLELHWTSFLLFGLIAFTLGHNFFPAVLPETSKILCYFLGVLTAIGLFFSIVFHEMAHSLVARIFKVFVKRITLFIFGGIARSEGGMFPSAKAEFYTALAGPLSSGFLVGFFQLLGYLGSGSFPPMVLASLGYLCLINAILAVFNLLAGFPMDGGRVLRALWWWKTKDLVKATRVAKNIGITVGILLPVGGYFLGGLFSALWILIIVWLVLIPAARAEYRRVLEQQSLGD